MLEKGIKAPDFSLLDKNGDLISLSDFIGKKVILYFYPKDNTPGCTKQACGFQRMKEDYENKNTVIIGISKDSISSHIKFSEKYDLDFSLLSDMGLEVIKLYDVWKEKNMYGNKTMGVVRTTYIINEDGIIVDGYEKVKADKNPEEMLKLV